MTGEPERIRFITVVFCDVAGSTELAATLSPDVWGAILGRYFSVATDVLTGAGGRMEKFIGDAVVAVFGSAVAREDDAVHAVRAAVALRDSLRAEGQRLRDRRGLEFAVRIGVASGRAALTPGRDSSFAIGAVLNRAARLQSAGALNDVVVDARTWLLVRPTLPTAPLGTLAAKGFPGGVRAWRVDDTVPQGDAASWDPEFVDRDDLLAGLSAYLDAGLAGCGPAVALVEGEAGIGKSRLLDRCWPRLSTAAERVVFHCARDGGHVGLRSLFALDSALRVAAGGTAAEPDAGAVASRPLAEVHWELRHHITVTARRSPLLLVVEDVQWAAPALVDFLRDVAAQPPPSFALALVGRTMPAIGDGTHCVRVPPLPGEYCRRLVDSMAGDVEPHADRPPADTMIAVSRGNPLYLTQVLTLAAEADGPADLFPPSAEAVIGARVDRLPLPAQRLLAVAGAFGGTATIDDLSAAAAGLGLRVEEPLAHLAEHQFVTVRGDEVRTSPPMAADVAYRRLRLAERAAVHDRAAAALRNRSAGGPGVVELIAHHAVTAHAAWRDFDPGSADERRAAVAAVRALCAAARFALLFSAVPLALEHLRVARETADGDPVVAVAVAAVEAYARLATGEPAVALRIADTALESADAAMAGGDPGTLGAAADLMLTAAVTREFVTGARDDALVGRGRALAVRSGDPAAVSRALLFEAFEATAKGDYPTAEHALTRSVAQARQAAACLSTAEAYGNLALCLAYGDKPAPAALAECRRLYREVGAAQAMRAAIGCPMAHLLHMLGRFDEATAALDEADAACERIGHRPGLAGVLVFRATLAERLGDLSAAVAHLSAATVLWERMGLTDAAQARRLHRDLLSMLDGGADPVPVSLPAETGWYGTVLNLQVTALRQRDAEPLLVAVGVLDRIRGSGAVGVPLLNCLRVARRIGAADLMARCAGALADAARRKGDGWLATHPEYS